jgi:predicted O-methyltransferase YrrM
MIYQTNPIVAMDENHIQLIGSLIKCSKPQSVLEIGIGTGLVTKTILESFEYNQIKPNLTCVDNFYDWSGNAPAGFETYENVINFISSDERNFIYNCKQKYDFIVSDADHHHTNEWVEQTLGILNTNGILIYHDVTNGSFPNLYSIIEYVKRNNINYILFDKSSRIEERCDRGLLVIYK